MSTHFFFVIPLFMVFTGLGIQGILGYFRRLRFLNRGVVAVLLLASLQPLQLARYFSSANAEREKKICNTNIYKNIRQVLPRQYKVVINVNSFEDVELMFYHNDITAYHWWLSEKDMEILVAKKVPIAAFTSRGDYNLPPYVHKYPYLFIIEQELK